MEPTEGVRALLEIEKKPLNELVQGFVIGDADGKKLLMSDAVAGMLFEKCIPLLKGTIPASKSDKVFAGVLLTAVLAEERYWHSAHIHTIEGALRGVVSILESQNAIGAARFFSGLLLLQFHCYRATIPKELSKRNRKDVKDILVKLAVGGYPGAIPDESNRASVRKSMTDDDEIDSTLLSNIIKQQFVYEERNEDQAFYYWIKNGHMVLFALFVCYVGYLKERPEFAAGAVIWIFYMEVRRQSEKKITYSSTQQQVLLSSSFYFNNDMRNKLALYDKKSS